MTVGFKKLTRPLQDSPLNGVERHGSFHPPSGTAYLVDSSGQKIMTDDGKYLLVKIEEPQ